MIPLVSFHRIWTIFMFSWYGFPRGLTYNVLSKAFNTSWNSLDSKRFSFSMCSWRMGHREELVLTIQSRLRFLVEVCHERSNVVLKHWWYFQVLRRYPFYRAFVVIILGLSMLRQKSKHCHSNRQTLCFELFGLRTSAYCRFPWKRVHG